VKVDYFKMACHHFFTLVLVGVKFMTMFTSRMASGIYRGKSDTVYLTHIFLLVNLTFKCRF